METVYEKMMREIEAGTFVPKGKVFEAYERLVNEMKK